MSGCGRPGPRLLDAPKATLEAALAGADDTPLTGHLAGCMACREAAERLLAAHSALDRALGETGRPPDFETLVSRGLAEREGPDAPVEQPTGAEGWGPAAAGLRGRARRAWRRVGGPATLLAAAAVSALLLVERGPEPLPGTPAPTLRPHPAPEVEVTDGRDVAVFATDDPDITVVWIF